MSWDDKLKDLGTTFEPLVIVYQESKPLESLGFYLYSFSSELASSLLWSIGQLERQIFVSLFHLFLSYQ